MKKSGDVTHPCLAPFSILIQYGDFQDHCQRCPAAVRRGYSRRFTRNLGVIIDSQLCLDAQVAAVCRCGYYKLRQLRPVIRSLSAKSTETLVQAFVPSRLDYVTRYCTASPTGYTVAFSLSRTPPHDSCSGPRGTTPRSHHADLTTSSLATRATASIVQNRCACLPMSERPGTVVPGG